MKEKPGPPYDLPDLRPVRAIQNRMRLQGGSVVTGNGQFSSEDYIPGEQGWRISGNGDAEFNDVTMRGTVAATSFDGTGTSLLPAIDDTDWTFESGSGTVTKLSDNYYRVSFTTAGEAVSPYIHSASSPHYSLHSMEVTHTDDPYNGIAAFGLEQENGGYYQLINLWPSIPSFHRMPLYTMWDGVRFVMRGQAGCFYEVFVEAIDPANLGGVIITESTKIIGNLDLEINTSAHGHMGHLTAAGNVAAGMDVTAAGNVAAGAGITAAGDIASTGGRLLAPNGSAGNPTHTFSSDPDTGMYRVGANHVGIAAGGSLSASFTANSTRFSDGTAAAPGIAFQSDTNTGILRSAADTMQFSCGGTVKLALASGAVLMDLAASATAYQPVHRDATFGTIVRYTSSRRFKKWIETFDGADLVAQLRPVTFYPKEGHGDASRQSVGFIAEEVADVDTRLTTTGPDGEPDGLDTNAMLAALVAEVQSLRQRVASLEAATA